MNEDEELEKQIRLQKKLLSDYNKLREAYYIDALVSTKND